MGLELPDRKNGEIIYASFFNSIHAVLKKIGLILKETTVDLTISGYDSLILVDASLNDVEITLPDVALNNGRQFIIVAKDNTNAISIVSQNGFISGKSSYNLRMQYESIRIFSDGVNWYAI